LLSLGAIVALIYLALNVGLRRLMAARGLPFARSGLVKVVERVMLDPKRALFVVHAAGDYLLLGGGDEGLSLIARLDSGEVERLLRQPNPSPARSSAFLQKLLSRRGEVPPGGGV
jgi:flagellar biogenesis protein FliO